MTLPCVIAIKVIAVSLSNRDIKLTSCYLVTRVY